VLWIGGRNAQEAMNFGSLCDVLKDGWDRPGQWLSVLWEGAHGRHGLREEVQEGVRDGPSEEAGEQWSLPGSFLTSRR